MEDAFRRYLQQVGDEHLIYVIADYVWLAAAFREDPPGLEFTARREACRAECARRGRPEIFQEAERILAPPLETESGVLVL